MNAKWKYYKMNKKRGKPIKLLKHHLKLQKVENIKKANSQ